MTGRGRETAAEVFEQRAIEYDQWFEESPVFASELQALRDLETRLAGPMLEVGVGPGRFAQALGVAFGVDPAFGPLLLASRRGISVCQGVGEALPVQSQGMGVVWLLFTLCFLAEPVAALAEVRRVLRPDGHLVVGLIVADSRWGKALIDKKRRGHPFYRHARLSTVSEAVAMLAEGGLSVVESRSSLCQPPEALTAAENSRPGVVPGAGFVALVAQKTETPPAGS